METRQVRRRIQKHTVYILLMVACSVLQGTPGLMKWQTVHSMPVIAAIAAISMAEGGFSGGLYGLLGGILIDVWAFHIFGVASVLFLIFGCAGGISTLLVIHANRKTAFLMTGLFAFLYGSLSHYVIYGLWGYEGAGALFWQSVLPSSLLTAPWGIVLFMLIERIRRRFEE
jgi:cell shape-determining protein MreD